jgi:hypothetical protein
MKALPKDPRQRQQSMEELFDELQRCYGSVRYRRSLDVRSAPRADPAAAREAPGSGPFSEPIARVTPPEFRTDSIGIGAGRSCSRAARKRRKTLPMELPAAPPRATARSRPAGRAAATRRRRDWVDMDVDARRHRRLASRAIAAT